MQQAKDRLTIVIVLVVFFLIIVLLYALFNSILDSILALAAIPFAAVKWHHRAVPPPG